MSEPLFSIIVPIYKIEKYIRQCIESVIKQSWKDFELILVDDGSPDGCGKIIDDYARVDERVKVIHKENGGLVHARMTGASAARGKYILNIDGDDYIEDGCLEVLASYAKEYDADVYCFGYFQRSEDRAVEMPYCVEEGLYDTEEKKKKILSKLIYDPDKPFYTFGMSPSVWTRMTKRELYVKRQMAVDRRIVLGEDLALTVPLMFEAKSIYIINKPFYDYRIIEGSMSHRFNPKAGQWLKLILETITEKSEIPLDSCLMRRQLGAYSVYMLSDYLIGAAKEAKNYEEYKGYISEIDDSVLKCMKGCKTRLDSARAAFLTVVVKRKMWRVLWITVRKLR